VAPLVKANFAMKPLPHHYDVHLAGGPSGYAQLSTAGSPELRMAPPVDFDGPGDAWSPEHLLLASVQACYLFTLRAIAGLSKMEYLALDLEASGVVDRRDGVTRFTEIVLRPRLTVSPGTDRQLALLVLERVEKKCLISASLSIPIRVEPQVRERQ
jgi:organic hydroperoxide reductase OsmC/OhrA